MSKTCGAGPHVQWNQLRPIPEDYDKPFDHRAGYHTFGDSGGMNGNAEAYNAEYGFELAKDLRNVRVGMVVSKPASSTGDYIENKCLFPISRIRGNLSKEPEAKIFRPRDSSCRDASDQSELLPFTSMFLPLGKPRGRSHRDRQQLLQYENLHPKSWTPSSIHQAKKVLYTRIERWKNVNNVFRCIYSKANPRKSRKS